MPMSYGHRIYIFYFLNIWGLWVSHFIDLIIIWHMGLCHFLKIWFTLLINQPFKTLLGASNFFFKLMDMLQLYPPFQKYFSASLPPKNCNFWLNILPLDFWFFKCSYCQILFITIVTMSLYLTVSRDNAGLMEILLISRISEFSYLQKGEVIHVPCISISIITVRSSLF